MIAEGKIFMDRTDAGIEVGRLLEPKYKDKNALVLGIPRGGIPVANEIARILHAEMSVLITKKLPHPRQPELAIGAVAEDGSVFLTDISHEIDKRTLQSVHISQLREIESRVNRFRSGKPLPHMHNRIVIIADDGIATGSTIVPAIKLCKSRKAAKVIVAAPVSGKRYVKEINTLADDVVIAEQPELFHSVGQVYDDFHSMSDEEVLTVLQAHESRYHKRLSRP